MLDQKDRIWICELQRAYASAADAHKSAARAWWIATALSFLLGIAVMMVIA